jgi:hypothetical protein
MVASGRRMGEARMRYLSILAVAVTLAAATPAATPARAQTNLSPESMEAARALFSVVFDHAFVALNAQAVEVAWPAIEGAVRAKNPAVDAATLMGLRREFERIRLARLHEMTKDLPALYVRHLTAEEMRETAAFYRTPTGAKMLGILPKILPDAFATILPRVQAMNAETQDLFLKLLRERGLLN